jgi:fatty-acyl-CoA synthase
VPGFPAEPAATRRPDVPMTVTGKPQKFLMREAMVEELGLAAAKTA